jgi:hypothetical protein
MKASAQPEPDEVDFVHSPVVDMKNAPVSEGGTRDLVGVDLSEAAGVVRVIRGAYETSLFNIESFFGWTLKFMQLQASLLEYSGGVARVDC